MNDDPTPPPVPSLDAAERARIRERLLSGLDDAPAPRRWRVPVAAAAAVVLVAGASALVAVRSGDDDRSESAPPAASGTPTPSPPSPTAQTSTETSTQTSTGPEIEVGGGAEACTPELRGILPGAKPVLSVPGTYGTTTYLVKGDRFVVCDTSGGIVTVHGPQPLDGGYAAGDVTPWRVSTNVIGADRRRLVTTFLAGGLVTSAALSWKLAYTFPDGHVERATTHTDDEGRTWWRMEYTPERGVLTDPRQNQTRLDKIGYDVMVGGTSNPGTLAWGLDTCAQANHGC